MDNANNKHINRRLFKLFPLWMEAPRNTEKDYYSSTFCLQEYKKTVVQYKNADLKTL
jgi:hypothetical protein